MTYALFPQIGIQFLENRNNPDFFEPVPKLEDNLPVKEKNEGVYTVSFKGQSYTVSVSTGGDIESINTASGIQDVAPNKETATANSNLSSNTEEICAPLSGTVWKILVSPNQSVNEGDTLLILEAMKMETEIKSTHSGSVFSVNVKEGDSVSVGQALLTLA